MDAALFKKSVQKLRGESRTLYNNFPNPLWCKALNTEVFFNAQGFHHLLYDGVGNKRSPREQMNRLHLIPFIVTILENTETFTYKKRVGAKEIEFWALESLAGTNQDIKTRVIIKRIGNGKIYFWSIIDLNPKNKKSLG